MSYARFSAESDVYVFFNADDTFECCACSLRTDTTEHFTANAKAMVGHLLEHRKAGHLVPQEAIDNIEDEANGDG